MPTAKEKSASPKPAKSDNRIKDFRALTKRAVLLNRKEAEMFDGIPDIILERVLDKNFNGNLALAERVLMNRFDQIAQIDRAALDAKKRAIPGLEDCSAIVQKALAEGRRVLFMTDNDNDGSLAQAVYREFAAALPAKIRANLHCAYAQPIGTQRGLNHENTDLLLASLGWQDEDVLLVTADIGINNRQEQKIIQDKYPKLSLIVTDHHLPVEGQVIEENERTRIFNPKYKPTEFFIKKNISGAATFSVLLKSVLQGWLKTASADDAPTDLRLDKTLKNIEEIAAWSNLLDFVDADIADMPLRPYNIQKSLGLRALMNVSNSMGPLVELDWSEREWQNLAETLPELDVQAVREDVEQVKGLNRYAGALLFMAERRNADADLEEDFYPDLAANLAVDDLHPDNPNRNFISQLRPHIFGNSASDGNTPFMNLLNEEMVALFESLRSIEKGLSERLRAIDMMDTVRDQHCIITRPRALEITKIFSRRLLGKIYNEDNNGFLLILDQKGDDILAGSMRAVYPIDEIIPDREKLGRELGVDIQILGHQKAAGFKMHALPGQKLPEDLVERLHKAISAGVAAVKASERATPLPFLAIDFASSALVQKLNSAFKAHLSNMNGLPCVMRLSDTGRDAAWVTDPSTASQVNLAEIPSKRRYGYQPVQTDFHGHAFVIPVEMLRTLSAGRFRQLMKMSYMDDGVFMASQLADPGSIKNLIDFRGDRTDQKDLLSYYWENFSDSHVIPLNRDDFRQLPYFRYNVYGQSEFESFERLIIDLLSETDQDVLAVIDTEGTGLGLAPKCFNIGATNLSIDPYSGDQLPAAEFDRRIYRDESGRSYLLSDADLAALQPATEESEGWRVFNATMAGKTDHADGFVLPAMPADVRLVNNFTRKDDTVLFNRTITGTASSYIIRDGDFAITPELENLTGINQAMLDRFGIPAAKADADLVDYYGNLKRADGSPAKIIFSAHNLPYDKGVISANLSRLNTLMNQHLLCDTAKIARSAKLAYDDTPVSSFEGVDGIPLKTYFFDSPFSSMSLSTFLDRAIRGKGGVYPDVTGRYLLSYNADRDTMSLIDRREINEVILGETPDGMRALVRSMDMPNNAVKYSVERLSSRAMIRNILLHDYARPSPVSLSADEKPYADALRAFQSQYHFDNTLQDNINFFSASQTGSGKQPPLEMLADVGQRFLSHNRAVQARFHDGWIYERVLSLYEPDASGKIPRDAIDQVAFHSGLPTKKIEQVLKNTQRFKKEFGLHHAIVHEQHNNIRQRSSDGFGLSDTAYESVLPNMLAMMKFYNPYTKLSDKAVDQLVDKNIRGAMVQLLVKNETQEMTAVDSFSMIQLRSFKRPDESKRIKDAKQWSEQGAFDGKGTPVKFKLGPDILPAASGVYGIPRRPLTDQDIEQASQMLQFVMVNEQVRAVTPSAKDGDPDNEIGIRAIIRANDDRAIACRDVLLDMFERIDFRRHDANVKKVSDLMIDLAAGAEMPKSLKTLQAACASDPTLIEDAEKVYAIQNDIEHRITGQKRQRVPIIDSMLASIAPPKGAPRTPGVDYDVDNGPVRRHDFLPELNIERRNPLRFALKALGPAYLSDYLASISQNKPARKRKP